MNMTMRMPSWETCDGCPSLLYDHRQAATCGREAVPMGPGCMMPRMAYEHPEFSDKLSALDAALRSAHD